ncbi:MAG: hypothetical protein Q7S33_00510 [Nanoarchaeota archaeon]|nr:hypothetical protein [Nanoarchaeota archaeon]
MHTGINVEEVKKRIVWFLNQKGPSLPVHLAKTTGLSMVFVSAILSEMLGEEKVKMSFMRIGSSPLYFLPGQESKLEEFADNLKSMEKAAFTKLKQNKFLKNDEQEPAIRVALSAIKDFAIPLKLDEEVIWKYFTISNEELIQIFSGKPDIPKIIPQKIIPILIEEKIEIKEEAEIKIEPNQNIILAKQSKKEETEETFSNELAIKSKKPKKEKPIPTKFLEEVKEFLLKKDIEFLQEVLIDKKEVIAKIRINSDLDKINFLMIAKDKKKISEADLIFAYQKASDEKMPCLVVFKGEVSKKIQEFLEPYKNLLKIIKMH